MESTHRKPGLTNLTEAGEGAAVQRLNEMRGWRRHLHANPELGFEEHDTAQFIRNLLDQWAVPYDTPLETATVAHLRGDRPGPTLAIRADIDALPIEEASTAPYRSTRAGAMHACGHDGHTAILLGLAKLWSERRSEVHGELRLIFQPAEELNTGAKQLVDRGVLDGASAVIGLHLVNWFDTGTIAIPEGPVLASDDRFDIQIVGAGGHGARPHETVDTIAIAAGLIVQLQTIVSRRIDPLSPAVLSVGSIQAGGAYSAIAEVADLSGTIRAVSPATRDQLKLELTRLTEGYTAAHQATAKVTFTNGCPPVLNEPDLVKFVRPAAEAVVGQQNVTAPPPAMGGEDFSFYGQTIPAVFALVGSGHADSLPHHHPQFDIDEKALVIGLNFLSAVVDRWNNEACHRI